ncbi:hypothetical protein CRYUN_Cryun21dG0100700 [Craigia yunnanensis]
MYPEGLQHFDEGLTEDAHSYYSNLSAAAIKDEHKTCIHYANKLKQRFLDQFKEGSMNIDQLAIVDDLYDMVSKATGASEPIHTYLVNISVFTSVPDYWAIGQLFPIGIHWRAILLRNVLGRGLWEALGGSHNLLGNPSVVQVSKSTEPEGFVVTNAMPGQSCRDVLRTMQHEPEVIFERIEGFGQVNGTTDGMLQSVLAGIFSNMPYIMKGSS